MRRKGTNGEGSPTIRPETRGQKNNGQDRRETPSREKLIRLLIEERAGTIAAIRVCRNLTGLRMRHGHKVAYFQERDLNQARREIEAEVLTTKRKNK